MGVRVRVDLKAENKDLRSRVARLERDKGILEAAMTGYQHDILMLKTRLQNQGHRFP